MLSLTNYLVRVTDKDKYYYIFVANYNRANDIHQYET